MPQATATVGGKVIASTDKWETVEGNVYFPPSTVDSSYLTKTDASTFCPWKGHASYYTIKVDGQEFKDTAWYYPETYEKANHIKDYVAFYKTKVDVKTS